MKLEFPVGKTNTPDVSTVNSKHHSLCIIFNYKKHPCNYIYFLFVLILNVNFLGGENQNSVINFFFNCSLFGGKAWNNDLEFLRETFLGKKKGLY